MVENKVGQVTRESLLGNLIYNFCQRDDIKVIVDVGTWNGLGTTKCIYDAIVDSCKSEFDVYSIESNTYFYNIAINNIPKVDNFRLILGRIVDVDDLINVNDYDDHFFSSSSREIQSSWMSDDISNYEKIDNIIDSLPKSIDLLILDGGEFSSLSEFNKLKDRTKYFILDDTKTIKNYKVADIIRNSKDYEVIEDSTDRNGFLIAKKII